MKRFPIGPWSCTLLLSVGFVGGLSGCCATSQGRTKETSHPTAVAASGGIGGSVADTAKAEVVETYVLRSKENPKVVPDCSGASFAGAQKLAKYYGDLFSIATRGHDGRVANDQLERVGGITVCLNITDWYTPHNQQPGYYRAEFNGMTMEGEGKTALLFRDSPAEWVVDACNAAAFSKLPPGYSAGSVVANSIGDLKKKGKIGTGSFWVFRLIRQLPPR